MQDNPIVFKTLTNIEEAEKIGEHLALDGIAYEIESPPQLLDRNFIGEQPMPEHYIKIRPADFTRANIIVDDLYSNLAATIEEDYYLFTFSAEQLQDVIRNRNEWGDLNYHLAVLLSDRKTTGATGVLWTNITKDAVVENIQPVPVNIWILAAGYFCLLTPPFLYGYPAVGSLFIGWFIVGASATTSAGIKYPVYNKTGRIHGKIMITLSIIVITCLLLILMNDSFATWFFDSFPIDLSTTSYSES